MGKIVSWEIFKEQKYWGLEIFAGRGVETLGGKKEGIFWCGEKK